MVGYSKWKKSGPCCRDLRAISCCLLTVLSLSDCACLVHCQEYWSFWFLRSQLIQLHFLHTLLNPEVMCNVIHWMRLFICELMTCVPPWSDLHIRLSINCPESISYGSSVSCVLFLAGDLWWSDSLTADAGMFHFEGKCHSWWKSDFLVYSVTRNLPALCHNFHLVLFLFLFFSKDELVLEQNKFVWRHCHSDFSQPKRVPLCLFCSCAPVQHTRERILPSGSQHHTLFVQWTCMCEACQHFGCDLIVVSVQKMLGESLNVFNC